MIFDDDTPTDSTSGSANIDTSTSQLGRSRRKNKPMCDRSQADKTQPGEIATRDQAPPDQALLKQFMLTSLRAAVLRCDLDRNELASIGVALKGDWITVDGAIDWLTGAPIRAHQRWFQFSEATPRR